MEELINQIKESLDHNLFYLALFSTFSLPDICGALETDGTADNKKYTNWFDNNVKKYDDNLNGQDIYYYRCSFLHQGLSEHKNSRYSRIIFIEPAIAKGSKLQFSGCFVVKIKLPESEKEVALIDLRIFCEAVISSVESWYEKMQKDDNFKVNYEKFMRRRLNEFGIYGVPVIT